MAISLFGYTLTRDEPANLEARKNTFIPPDDDGGASTVSGGGYFGTYVDLDATAKNESEVITRYRETSLYSDVSNAIDEIITEAVAGTEDEKLVQINLDNVNLSENIKLSIRNEFNVILRMLEFKTKGADIFRRWYIDGRIYYQKVIDNKNPKQGVIELRYIDPRKIKKVRDIKKERSSAGIDIIKSIEEFYVYNEKGLKYSQQYGNVPGLNQGIKISPDTIAFVPSGLMDMEKSIVLGYLHKAVKPANQLKMMEDSLVIYRISRAPERRIFYIDVGNLPKIKAEQYLKDVMNKYRNKIVYDSNTGEIRDDRKFMCLAMDTKVPLLDGRILTINEITEEFNNGKKLWAYSCNPETGEFAPGLISWAGVTRRNAQVMKITLDNNKEIICTPDHKFPVWNKGFVEAENLKIGESMIPHYSRLERMPRKNNEKTKLPYLQIFDNKEQRWLYAHRLISRWKDRMKILNEWTYDNELFLDKKRTVHHKDFNKDNNNPDNLVRMSAKDHIRYHQSLISKEERSRRGKIGGKKNYDLRLGIHSLSPEEMRKRNIAAGKIGGRNSSLKGKSQENLALGRSKLANLLLDENWNAWFRKKQVEGWDENKRKIASVYAKNSNLSLLGNLAKKKLFKDKTSKTYLNHLKLYKTEYTSEMFNTLDKYIRIGLSASKIAQKINEENNISDWAFLNRNKVSKRDWLKVTGADITRMTKELGMSFSQYKNLYNLKNHKIISITYLDNKIDTGCITIDKDEIYHNYHTFALDAGIYTKNSMLEDFWLPRREGGRGTEITTLPGGENLGQIDDVNYFKNKLYQSLNVPVSRLESSSGMNFGRSAEINRDELKFGKFIDRLRKRFNDLFQDILRTQLLLKGIMTDTDWNEIKEDIYYTYAQDSYYSELKDAENIRNRVEILTQIVPYVGQYFSKEYVMKKILRYSNDEIEQIESQMQGEGQPASPEVKQ